MKKILVIAPSWVGDCMLMQPMLMRLKQRYPDCQIDVLAPAWTAGLLNALPEVNLAIVNPFPHGALQLKARYRLGVALRAAHYDQAIVLPNSFKSVLTPFFARIPLRTGFTGEMRYRWLNDARKLDKNKLPLMVERFAYLAEDPDAELTRPPDNPKLAITTAQVDATLQKLELSLNQPVAIFCPGAEYGPAKRWPAGYFAAIANPLAAQGYAVWLIGSAKDHQVADEIAAISPALNLCGKTDLSDAIALLSVAQLVISNDSGLMHLAAALDRPLIALFGSSSPEFTPPLSPSASIVKLDLECSPCFKRVCPLGHFNCMNQLTPELVWGKIQPILRIT